MKILLFIILIIASLNINTSFSENDIPPQEVTVMKNNNPEIINNKINILGSEKGLPQLTIRWKADNNQNHIAEISYNEKIKTISFTKQEYERALFQKSFSNETLIKIDNALSILLKTNEPPARKPRL